MSSHLFLVSALIEIAAGLILLATPTPAIAFVFGSSGNPAVAVGRIAGAALLALGTACWGARHDRGGPASRGLIGALLTYNVAIVTLVASASLGSPGPLLWAVAMLHAGLAIWCVWALRNAVAG
jgi:hypothetical protein